MKAGERIVVYHIPLTRSERVVWLLEEIGLPYDVHHLSYRSGDLRSTEFLAVNPMGMVPAISVGGMAIRETGAIFEYVLRGHRSSLAIEPGDDRYADYLVWLHSVEATVFQNVAAYIMNTIVLPEAGAIA